MDEVLAAIIDTGVVVLVRLPGPDGLDEIVRAAVRGGARAFEVTMNTPGALDWLAGAHDRHHDVVLGMGTVITEIDLGHALVAGARFVVSPSFDPAVVADAMAAGVLAVPGTFTPTEIVAARAAGARLIKLFPSAPVGPGYVRNVLGPLDDVDLLCTGGIEPTTAAGYIAAGAKAVAVGGSIITPALVARRAFDEIEAAVRATVDAVRDAGGATIDA